MKRASVALALKECVGPDCACSVEDRLQGMHGLLEVADSLRAPGGGSASDNTADLVADLLERRR